jgi:hypothetical protein
LKSPLHVYLLAPIPYADTSSLRIPISAPSLVRPMRRKGSDALSFTVLSYRPLSLARSGNINRPDFVEKLDAAFFVALKHMRKADTASIKIADNFSAIMATFIDDVPAKNMKSKSFEPENQYSELGTHLVIFERAGMKDMIIRLLDAPFT